MYRMYDKESEHNKNVHTMQGSMLILLLYDNNIDTNLLNPSQVVI